MTRKLAIGLVAAWSLFTPLAAPRAQAQDAPQDTQDPGAGAATAAETDRDRSYLTGLIEDNLSGEGRTIRLDGFEGALSSRATFDSLSIADADGVWLRITDGAMSWSRTAILRGEFRIDELSAASIELTRLPSAGESDAPAPEAQPFALPELPVSVVIGTLDVDQVALGETILGQPLQFAVDGSLRLEDGEGAASLNLTRSDAVRGTFQLNAAYTNATEELSIDLLADEGQGGLVSSLAGLPGEPAVTLAVAGTGPLSDFTANVSLATDGRPRITGNVAILDVLPEGAAAGTAPDRTFRADLSGDITPMLPEAYRGFFGDSLQLSTEGALKPTGALELSALDLQAQALSLNGSLALLPSGLPQRIDLDLSVGLASGDPVLLPISGPETRIDGARLQLGYDQAQGDGWLLDGTIDGLNRPELDLTQLRLDGSGRIAQRMGQPPTVGGTVSFAASGIALADQALQDAVGPFLTGRTLFSWQKAAPLRLSNLTATGRNYGLDGQLSFTDPAQGVALRVNATLRHDDLSSISGLAGRDLGGAVQADIRGGFTVLSGAFDADLRLTGEDLTIDQPQADAALAGRSEIALQARRDEGGLVIERLTASSAALQAEASGVLASGASQLRLDADADLSVLGAGFTGTIDARAALTETEAGRRITLDATARDMAVGQPQLDPLLRGETVLAVDALEKDGAITLDRATLANPRLDADISGLYAAGASDLAAQIRADLTPLPQFGGVLDAQASLRETGTRRDVTLEASGQSLAIGQPQVDSLLRGLTRLSLAASEDQGRIELQSLNLSNPQLSAEAAGAIEGTARRVTLNARLNDLALLAPGFGGPATVSGTVIDDGRGYDVDIGATGPGGIDADVSGRLASDFSNANLSITGGAQAALANAFIAPRTIEGPIRFDLRMNGAPGLAALSGTASVNGARLSAPALDMVLEGIDLTANLSGGQVRLDGAGTLGTGGTIAISGPITLSPPFRGDLVATLTEARLRDPDLYDTRVSGTVQMNGPLTGGARISGNLALSETELSVPAGGLGGIEAIPDITHLGESAASRTTRARAGVLAADQAEGSGGGGTAYPLDVTISAPNQIFVRGRGLDAELGGQLRITGTTANVIPIGSFDLVRGRLSVLNQRFDLDRGQISLQGEFVPYIEFAATTTQNDYTITISIYGDATAPELSISSAPELPEEEVLAQLLFSRGLDNISALQAAQLASAVATLAGRGGNGIIGNLREATGLDDLDVGTDDDGNATLRAGKYLSDNVYTDVEVGSDGTSTINLNLDISDHITARGGVASDGDSSIGIFLEKDY